MKQQDTIKKAPRKKMNEWANRLGFDERKLVVQLYCNGVSISAITTIYQVHHSSIRYHLKKANVYIKGKTAEINMNKIRQLNNMRSMVFHNARGGNFSQKPYITFDADSEFESTFPNNYKEYLERDRLRKEQKKYEYLRSN